MIWVTGDTHADWIGRLNKFSFPEQLNMTKDDYVIILGDFGLWNKTYIEDYGLKYLNELPFTTLFIDGNHENFDRLYSYPVSEWHGGKVHYIKDSVIHLMRGQIFDINDNTFFTFGGAKSQDIRDGILDLDSPELVEWRSDRTKKYRVNHISWWKEEMPSQEEMDEGLQNLKLCGNKVDFILTHCVSSSTQALLSHGEYTPDELTKYLEEIRCNTEYKKWLFGHYHRNMAVNDKDICLYEQIVRIS